MGLKKTNYEVKDLGLTLSTAYAIIHRLEVDGDKGVAEFYIQNSPREKAFELKPLERVIIPFDVNRNESPFITAYTKAKGTYTVKAYNVETHQYEDVEKPMPLNGWEDDIAEEEVSEEVTTEAETPVE